MSNKYTNDERAFVHFGFSVQQLYEDFHELSENAIKDNFRTLQDMLLSKFPSEHEKIQIQIASLEEIFLAKAQEPLHKFKETTNEIFALPTNNLESSREESNKSVTSQELKELKKEVDDLEQKYLQGVYDQMCLKNELEKFEKLEPLLNRVNEVLKFSNSNRLKAGEKTTEELCQGLKAYESFYYKKCSGLEKPKSGITDVFNLFKTE